ncbi:MAG: DNA circularization N-terminal domain-containing protein [Dehalococcoidia bacterium]|jgi:prophage DNA circulation protein|nr:DNA circularization N-terminal domain-containing protein [Dehalococcoidia bacterium]
MIQDWEVLAQLLPLTWRGIEVPCIRMGTACGNRLAEHEQYAVPASDVENGGRKSAKHSFTIPFRRLILGYSELYPRTFRQFLKALLNPDVGKLQHPEFGLIDCQVGDWSFDWVAEKRDGCDLQVTFIETNENGLTLEKAAPSVVDAQQLALDMAVMFLEADPPIVYEDPSGLTLAEQLAKVASLKLLAELEVASALAEVQRVIDGVNGILDVVGSLTDPNASAMYSAGASIVASMEQLTKSLTVSGSGKRIVQKINDKERTVAEASAHFGLATGAFYSLNPASGRSGTVLANQTVLVYEGGA